MKYTSIEEIKSKNGGKINPKFQPHVPKIKDHDIQDLISKYPVDINPTESEKEPTTDNLGPFKRDRLFGEDPNDPVIQALKCKDKQTRNKMYKRAFESMI